MTRALWIPAALRDHGLDVIEHPGWQARGHDTLNPRGVVCHHTASAATSGDAPSLSTVINGRPDLPGPLCHVLIGRTGTCHIIAAGTANHAGPGSWRGLTGNSSVLGIEAENNGLGEPWTPGLLDAFARCAAALAQGAGAPIDNVCLHREWAPTRKPDPAGPGFPQDGNEWRRRVAAAEGGTVTPEQMAQIGEWMQEQRALTVKEVTAAIVGTKEKPGRVIRKLNRLLVAGGLKESDGD